MTVNKAIYWTGKMADDSDAWIKCDTPRDFHEVEDEASIKKKKKTNDFETKTNFDFIAISLTGHCLLIKEAMKFGMSYIIDIQSLGITQLSVSNLLMWML